MTSSVSARQHADLRAELPGRRAGDRDAAAERPQLHRPGAAAARACCLSVARRRLGRRARARHERQRAGLPLQRLPARRHAAERLHERAGRQRRRHDARHGDDPRVPRRVERLQRGVRPQLRRPDQRPHQVGHQHAARQRLRVPPQRRARRRATTSTSPASPTSRATSSAARSAARCEQDRLFYFVGYEGLRENLGKTITSFVPDDNARRGILPDGPVTISDAVRPYLDAIPRANGPVDRRRPRDAHLRLRAEARSGLSSRAASTTSSAPAHQLFARYTYDDGEQRLPTDYPQFPRSFISTNQFFTAEYRNVLSDADAADGALRLQPHARSARTSRRT